jgi:hypothetical protein
MKRLLTLVAVTLFASPLLALADDAACSGYQQLAALYEVRNMMLRGDSGYTIDEAISHRVSRLREGWVRWVRPSGDAAVDKHVHVVAASNGATSDNFEATGEHPFAVKVVVPAKRSLFNKNNPVYVAVAHVRYVAGGRERTKDLPVNAWMNPDTSKTLDLGVIADRADASLEASSRNPGEAVVEFHFVEARAEDDPANPAYDTIRSLERIRRNTDAYALDQEIAKREREMFPETEPYPVTQLMSDLRRADELIHSKKDEDHEKGEKLLREAMRRLR